MKKIYGDWLKGGIAPVKKIKIKFSNLERAVEYAKKKDI